MISNAIKIENFRRAVRHGVVTITYDSQVTGVVQPAPRSREPARWDFDHDALVTDDAIRTPTDAPLVHVPWSAVIAITLESAAVLYVHDADADARREKHGKHLRLVRVA